MLELLLRNRAFLAPFEPLRPESDFTLGGQGGYATGAVRLAVGYAFDELGLHRVQANVMTKNPRSARVLEKAGFRKEGLALRYLQIAGRWEDHDMFAVTTEDVAD